jgi:hypothetical protein
MILVAISAPGWSAGHPLQWPLSHCIIIPENLFDRRLAMSSLDKMLGWFPHSSTEWFELIIVALLLWC